MLSFWYLHPSLSPCPHPPKHELSLTQQQSLNSSLDIRVKSLQDELARMETALRLTQQEHESYKVCVTLVGAEMEGTIIVMFLQKVRVHSVLKQKTTGPSVTEVERSLR